MMLGESWQMLMQLGHRASIVFVVVFVAVVAIMYLRFKHRKASAQAADVD